MVVHVVDVDVVAWWRRAVRVSQRLPSSHAQYRLQGRRLEMLRPRLFLLVVARRFAAP